jgi:hypothetical protein
VSGLHPDFEKEVTRTAVNRGLDYNFIDLPKGNDKAAANELFEAILAIAQKRKAVA